jgi:nucleoside-diphosphate-sugar epimerase
VNENSDIRPYNLYASTKASFENMLKYYVDKKGLSGLTLRLFAPYGMYDKPNKVIPLIIRSAIEDDVLELASNGYHKWDYVFAGDVSDAFLAAVDVILSGRIKYEAINVGSGSSLSLREIAELIESVLHRKLQINWGQKLEELNNVVADIQKARDILGWHPKTSLRDGLEITSNWIREMDGLSR